MSDPFIPVSSQNGLEIPWDMIMSEGATWNPPREGASPIPNMPVYSQPTMTPIRQYPSMPQPQYPYPQPQYPAIYDAIRLSGEVSQPYNPTMPTQRIDYNLPIDGVCEAKEVVLQCPVSAIKQNRYAPPAYTQPTGGTSPLSFFVG